MKHPSIQNLALMAGGELGWWTGITVQRHVKGCEQCQKEVSCFGDTAGEVRGETGEMPANVQWDRLAGEMRANIRVGLAASEAISSYSKPLDLNPVQGMSWRMAALTTGFVMLLSVGYWLNASKKSEQLAALRGPEPMIAEASEDGVGMMDGGKELLLQSPKAGPRASIVVTVSTVGSAGARYVDEDTGQVTVNHVYVE